MSTIINVNRSCPTCIDNSKVIADLHDEVRRLEKKVADLNQKNEELEFELLEERNN